MKLHYYESILNFYCDSLTEEELLEKIREWTLRYLWYRKKREEEEVETLQQRRRETRIPVCDNENTKNNV